METAGRKGYRIAFSFLLCRSGMSPHWHKASEPFVVTCHLQIQGGVEGDLGDEFQWRLVCLYVISVNDCCCRSSLCYVNASPHRYVTFSQISNIKLHLLRKRFWGRFPSSRFRWSGHMIKIRHRILMGHSRKVKERRGSSHWPWSRPPAIDVLDGPRYTIKQLLPWRIMTGEESESESQRLQCITLIIIIIIMNVEGTLKNL